MDQLVHNQVRLRRYWLNYYRVISNLSTNHSNIGLVYKSHIFRALTHILLILKEWTMILILVLIHGKKAFIGLECSRRVLVLPIIIIIIVEVWRPQGIVVGWASLSSTIVVSLLHIIAWWGLKRNYSIWLLTSVCGVIATTVTIHHLVF